MPQLADVIAVDQLATKTRGSPAGRTPDAWTFQSSFLPCPSIGLAAAANWPNT